MQLEKSSRGAAFGDYDNDGDIDAVVIDMHDRPTMLRNDTTRASWIALRLVGPKGARDAVGAEVAEPQAAADHTVPGGAISRPATCGRTSGSGQPGR